LDYRIAEAAEEARDLAQITTQGLWTAVHNKILPTFANISAEARVIYETNLAHLRENDSKPDEPAEWEAGLEAQTYEYAMRSARQTLLNGLTIVLWHFFQQSFVALMRRMTEHAAGNPDDEWKEYRKALRETYGLRLERFQSWPKLDELWFASNAVKHGDGPSCAELKRMRPDLFRRKWEERESKWDLLDEIGVRTADMREPYQHYQKRLRVVAPLSQHEIALDEVDIDSYCDAIIEFWTEFATELDVLGKSH
jgi:DNA-directed RNA polymerase subunit N (RpoN/RPB10)